MSNGEPERRQFSLWDWFLNQLGLVTRRSFSLFFSEKEIEPPDTLVNRVPFYLRRARDIPELFLVSKPMVADANTTYGFHIIRFDGVYGFFWFGDFYDEGLPSTAQVLQVVTGRMAFVRVERSDNASESGVRLYRTDWLQTPPAEFVRLLHGGEKIVDMGGCGRFYTTLVSEDGMVYLYEYNEVDRDVRLVGQDDTIKSQGAIVLRANVVVSPTDILIETQKPNGSSELWHLRCFIPGSSSNYPVIGRPAQDALGDRHVTLRWQGFPQKRPCDYTMLLVTGGSGWISMYSVITGYFQLVKFKASDGTLHDRYNFPEPTFDWDVGFEAARYNGILKIIRATTEGLRVDRFVLSLSASSRGGDGFFQFESSSLETTQEEMRCVFWNRSIPAIGYFSAGLSGRLRASLLFRG
jgi:hypothetical protein